MVWAGLSPLQALLVFIASGALIGALHWGKGAKRVTDVPLLTLWESLPAREGRGVRTQLRKPLSLALSVALLASLVLSLGDLRPAAPSRAKRWAVVLDTGPSMAARDYPGDRLTFAKQQLSRLVERIPARDSVDVFTLGASLVLQTAQRDQTALSAMLARVNVSDRPANLESAMRTLLLEARPDELVLVSDGRLQGAQGARALLRRAGVRHRQLPVGKRASNLAITQLSARAHPLDPSRDALLFTVHNSGDRAEHAALTLDVGNIPLHREQLMVPAHGEVTKTLPASTHLGSALRAHISTNEAANLLTRDDEAQLDLPPRKATRVWVAGRGNRYLEAALLLDEQLDVHWSDEQASLDPNAYDVAVWPAPPPDPLPAIPSLFLAPLAGEKRTALGQSARPYIETWERDHPALRGLALGDVNITSASNVPLAQGERALATSNTGRPLIVQGQRAGAPFLLLRFDARQSDLPLRSAWPLFILRSIRHLAGATASSEVAAIPTRDPNIAAREVLPVVRLESLAGPWYALIDFRHVCIAFALLLLLAEWMSARPLGLSRWRKWSAVVLRSAAGLALGLALLHPASARPPTHDAPAPRPPPPSSAPSLYIDDLALPSRVQQGVPFDAVLRINAAAHERVQVQISREDEQLHSQHVTLHPGSNSLRGPVSSNRAGDVLLRATIVAEGGSALHFERSVHVVGKARVLVVARDPQRTRPLVRLLEASQLEVDVRTPNGAPRSAAQLDDFAFFILSDVPRSQLSAASEQAISSFVHSGGGFLMAGGEQSFGPGGYQGSLLAEQLPVRMQRRDTHDEPSLALSLVIDKSGSMSNEKIALAKEAARATAASLHEDDYLGVIGFDAAPSHIVRLATVRNRSAIERGIDRLQAGGGTAIFPALDAAYAELGAVRARKKHVILLTDGQTRETGLELLVENMQLSNITLSTIGLGSDVSRKLLEELARIGRGRAYFTDDPNRVPQLFLHDTETVARPASVEQSVLAYAVSHAAFLEDIDWRAAPPLLGYVATLARSAPAELVLATASGDPLLARMRVGMGWSLAFTSDLEARWSAHWFGWRDFGRMLTQLLRAHMRSEGLGARDIVVRFEGDELVAHVDMLDGQGRFLDGARGTLQARNLSARTASQSAPLRQIAAGRYEARIALPQVGAYALTAQLDEQRAYGSAVHRTLASAPAPPALRRQPAPKAGMTISAALLAWLGLLAFLTDSIVRKLAVGLASSARVPRAARKRRA